MKISCQSCQAKYTIADEKVVGKIVKIRCKKCGATIVINGNEHAASPGDAQNVVDDAAQAGTEPWTVNVADGDQRSMTSQEIVQEYRAGVVNDETYCWKDGMSDWLPLREIEQLHAACTAVPRPPAEPYASDRPPAVNDNETTTTEQVPISTSVRPEANGNGANGGLFGSAPASTGAASGGVAARRVGGRGVGGDLFGGVSAAGGEEDVMTSVPSEGSTGPVAAQDSKLTGQRNENSVLFSLSALTSEGKPASKEITADGSGLIDIRALSQTMGGDAKGSKNNHVDDIMNLGGGGAFGAALAAPILAPPPLDPSELSGSASTGGKGKNTVLFAVIGVVMLVMFGTIVFLITRKSEPPATQALPTATATTPEAVASTTAPADSAAGGAATAGAVAMNDTAKAPTDPKTAAVAPTAPKAGGGTPSVAPKSTGGTSVAPAVPAPAVPDLPKPKAGGGSGGLADAIRDSAGGNGAAAPAAPAPASDKPFDRGAAQAALGSVNVASCKRPDGPTGSGHVSVTFGPDGSVVSALVDQPPFAGTPVGGCVAGKFRSARVPAFSGGNIRVGKSFIIN